MIRRVGLILIVLLMLCGCQQTGTGDTAGNEMPETNQQLPHDGLYCAESEIELATGGAIRNFHNAVGGFENCFLMGEDICILSSENGMGYLSVYRGENLELLRKAPLGENVSPHPEQIQATEDGIGYYDSENKAVVFLNANLVEIGRVPMPEDIQGNAWLTPDWTTVYYCTSQGIISLDLQTNISHLLRQQEAFHQEITGEFAQGKYLRYVVQSAQGTQETLLIDASTGMEFKRGEQFNALATKDDEYFLPQIISGVRLLCFGDSESHQVLWPEDEQAQAVYLFDNDAVVTVQKNDDGIALCYYDLVTGKCSARISLPKASEVWSMTGDGEKGVWFFCRANEDVALYHWNTLKSLTAEETIYTAPRYTHEKPNEEKLAELTQKAEELGNKFGVKILLWQSAAEVAPEDYLFQSEHITQAYEAGLLRLEQYLSVFPERFFTKKHDQKLKIALVREITGNPEWGGMAQTEVLQFWTKDVPVLALTMSGNFEQNFYHGIAHYMDTILLSQSSAAYEWNTMNPEGFKYDNSYVTNLERTDKTYIDGEKRYFIDLFSMSFAKEDRARIFEYACMPGNEEIFQSPVLQEKLSRICKAIRQAFGLKKVEEVFLWEQYLKTE